MVDARACCKCFTVSLVPVTVFCLAIAFLGGIVILPTLYVELASNHQVRRADKIKYVKKD